LSSYPAPALERRTSNPTPCTNSMRNNYPPAIDQLLHAPRVAPQTMTPTWNKTDDPYNAEGEEESPHTLSCRMQSEYSQINRRRRLFKTGTANLIPPATTEAMDTSDNCPGPAAEPESSRQTPATAPGPCSNGGCDDSRSSKSTGDRGDNESRRGST
jgi:hypothetical protein